MDLIDLDWPVISTVVIEQLAKLQSPEYCVGV
jgi:hypothetical protein